MWLKCALQTKTLIKWHLCILYYHIGLKIHVIGDRVWIFSGRTARVYLIQSPRRGARWRAWASRLRRTWNVSKHAKNTSTVSSVIWSISTAKCKNSSNKSNTSIANPAVRISTCHLQNGFYSPFSLAVGIEERNQQLNRLNDEIMQVKNELDERSLNMTDGSKWWNVDGYIPYLDLIKV